MAYHGGTLKSTSINGVKVYSLTGHQRSLATWLNPKKQRALRKDTEYSQRVELIQDLNFETATTKIKATPDGEFLLASGIYPPQVKVYELRELSLKFERHLVSEIVDFEVLSDDYSKIAFMCADRSICLHAKYGSHYKVRIPRMGRDMAYDSWSCDLLCAASSTDLYRINLSQGRFLAPLTTQSPGLNVVSRSNCHGLVACGGEDGAVECFDMRARSSVGRINAVAAAEDDGQVTAIEFDDEGGFQMAVGSSEGKVLIYDLRSSHPIRVKDHMYGSPILDIKWHRTLNSEHPKIISTDNHIVRIWDPETGVGMTSIEPTGGAINDICVIRETGLMLLALDSTHIPSYFIPALGPAPKWCSYLENLTEELEENAQTSIYDDYKFLTKEELERLNLTNLIGTNLLRAYMHGYFIDYRLYKKAKSITDPFAYDAYIEKRKKEKLEAMHRERITIKRKLPKVNRHLVRTLLEDEEAAENDADKKKSSKKKKGLNSDILNDDRFAELFENPEFEIDENSQEYMALHPIAPQKQTALLDEHFEPIMEDEMSEGDASSDDEGRLDKKSQTPRLYEVKDERHAQAFLENVSLANEDALPLGERVAALHDDQRASRLHGDVKVGRGGSREISFVSRSKAKYQEDEDNKDPRHCVFGLIWALWITRNNLRFRSELYYPQMVFGVADGWIARCAAARDCLVSMSCSVPPGFGLRISSSCSKGDPSAVCDNTAGAG
uniref:Nucleolar protein 10 n=1 Tax=Chenopodium quinoa TaxID=63459 RepID=A0A803M631_CHEQI